MYYLCTVITGVYLSSVTETRRDERTLAPDTYTLTLSPLPSGVSGSGDGRAPHSALDLGKLRGKLPFSLTCSVIH